MTRIVEISVRSFFMAEGGIRLNPAATFLCDMDKVDDATTDLEQSINGAIAVANKQLENLSLEGIRPMTKKEIVAARKEESDEARADADAVADTPMGEAHFDK